MHKSAAFQRILHFSIAEEKGVSDKDLTHLTLYAWNECRGFLKVYEHAKVGF